MIRSVLILFSIALITGCDCNEQSAGTVLDDETGIPLDSVHVRSFYGDINEDNETFYMMTDSTGAFTSNNAHKGAANCDLYVTFARDGYKAEQLHNPRKAVEVRMERI
ncbi:MAG: hypothetical protein R2813_13685 [Flavobacteriales bacterium]